jgi:acetolactate synthase-1/2/3 large subunit
MTGFWGTPIANEKCRTADLILAVGTRLAEANSSSWDPRFTFDIPPTRLFHVDADVAEIGRNFPTELGVVADATGAGALVGAAGRQAPLAARCAESRRGAGLRRTGPTITARTSSDAPRADPERVRKAARRRHIA